MLCAWLFDDQCLQVYLFLVTSSLIMGQWSTKYTADLVVHWSPKTHILVLKKAMEALENDGSELSIIINFLQPAVHLIWA